MTPSGKVFIRAIMRSLGVTRQVDLYRALHKEVDQPNVNKWYLGKSEPQYQGMMVMLIRAGWLTEEAREHLAAVQAEEAKQLAAQAHPGAGLREKRRRLPMIEEQG